MHITSAEQIERIRVLVNPHATCVIDRKRREGVKAQIRELAESRTYGSRVLPLRREDRIDTDKDPALTAKRLDDTVGQNELILIVGGDGTGNNWTNASLLHAESPHVKEAACLMLGGGFADDGPGVLNSKKALRRPSTILDEGEIVSFHPIDWQLGDERRLTNLYGTLGGSAAGALAINLPENRGAGQLRKAWLVYQALRSAPLFSMSENGGPPEDVFEFGLANSTTMANFEGCFPYSLVDPRVFRYQFGAKQVLRSSVRLKLGIVPGQAMEKPFAAELLSPTVWQGDGEAREVSAGTLITAQAAAESLRIYSTLLANAEAV